MNQKNTKIVLITGAGKRLGEATALKLHSLGMNIIIHYNKSKIPANILKREIVALGVRCETIKCNFNDRRKVDKFYSKASKLLGKISCLINNASVFENDKILNFTPKSWDKHLDTNLYAPIKLSKDFAKEYKNEKNGNIINILDQGVINPSTTFFSYNISKAALHSATVILAKSLAPNIRVNAIGPGPTIKNEYQSDKNFKKQVKSTLLKKGSKPTDISNTLNYILATESLTGQLIVVDGGEHLS